MERAEIFDCMSEPQFLWLPGKSGDKQLWLPFWIHSSDTEGTMVNLLSAWLSQRTKQALCVDEEELARVCRFLALVHDIGKLTPAFLTRILPSLPELRERLEAEGIYTAADAGKNDSLRHPLAGAAILQRFGCPPGIVSVVGAHHGKPLSQGQDYDLDNLMEADSPGFYGVSGRNSLPGGHWAAIRDGWFTFALKSCGYKRPGDLPELDIRTQVLLTGLLIMADWIASNQSYFPLLEPEDWGETVDLEQRIDEAWNRFDLRDIWSPQLVFPDDTWFEDTFGFPPNREQKTTLEAAGDCFGPGIFILEAQMGRGKTEAALAAAEILAGRLGCAGLYFGLPTQATANGIFPRLLDWGERQAGDLALTIRLAHGMAALNEDYCALFHGDAAVDDDGDGGLLVHPWFKGRKQALLSDFVIGTVDQLLMAALKQKHLMLRHLGLSGKVVILDECHAYDAYMNQYLDRALNWLGRYGVPVIILSATLPAERRAGLVDAYLNRSSVRNDDDAWRSSRDYPLLTWTQGDTVLQKAIPTEGPGKTVSLGRLEDGDLSDWLREQLREGGCAGVIVNTVRRAQEMAEELERKIPEARVEVFHSQFIQPDRAEKEAELVRRLGKASCDADRDRLIVVGTQVLEQSLDIDFDCMVTDLCPMDLLFQRIGRLHRHDRADRPVPLREPVCMVLGARGEDLEPGGRAVYGRWLLLRTRQLLPEEVSLPESIPQLVQETYARPEAETLEQEGMREAWEEYQTGRRKKERKADAFRIAEPEEFEDFPDLNTMNGWLDDHVVDTDVRAEAKVRDTESTFTVLVMERSQDGDIHFLPWREKMMSISAGRMPEEDIARMIAAQRITLPRVFCSKERVDATIEILEEENRTILPEWHYSSWLKEELVLLLDERHTRTLSNYTLRYDRKLGLLYQKENTTT